MTWDPTGDYAVFDGTEALTFRSRTTGTATDAGKASVTWATVAITKALRRQVSLRAIEAGGGRLKMGDAVFELAAEELGDVEPKEGDQLVTADGHTWRVVAVDRKPLVGMFRVFGRR